jgi:lysophospholipase L1-like esterase
MKTILCYGDSNTFGWIPKSFDPMQEEPVPSENRFSIEERWTGILKNKLGKDYVVIEEGLNGRTTVWDDPIEGEFLNGKKYLLPCLKTHAPVDLVIIMLGTNDLKKRFSVTAYDIAMSIAALIDVVRISGAGHKGGSPDILVVSPPPIGPLTEFGEMLEEGIDKSKKFSIYYNMIADQFDCNFLDAGKIIKSSKVDGIHFDKDAHEKLGRAAAEKVTDIFEYNKH